MRLRMFSAGPVRNCIYTSCGHFAATCSRASIANELSKCAASMLRILYLKPHASTSPLPFHRLRIFVKQSRQMVCASFGLPHAEQLLMSVLSFSPFVADLIRVLLCVVFFFGTAWRMFSHTSVMALPGRSSPTPCHTAAAEAVMNDRRTVPCVGSAHARDHSVVVDMMCFTTDLQSRASV